MEPNRLMSFFVRVSLDQATNNYTNSLSATGVDSNGDHGSDPRNSYTIRWSSLLLAAFMIWGAAGNALVCIAIFTDRRLQNVTNYFLFSLAIADLLVSLIVMPFSILTELHDGYWHYGFTLCAGFSYADVFLCSASIVHMSIISLDRYLGISRPLKTRNKSKLVVVFKIIGVWVITTMISCPIAILAIVNPRDIYHDHVCSIDNQYFLIYGSTLAFLIPCLIMVATYVRTTQLLRQQALLCSSASNHGSARSNGGGANGNGGGGGGGGGVDSAPAGGLRRTRTRRTSSKKSNHNNNNTNGNIAGGGGSMTNYHRKRHSSSDSRSVTTSRRNSPSYVSSGEACLRPPSLKRYPATTGNRAYPMTITPPTYNNHFHHDIDDDETTRIELQRNDRLQVILPPAVVMSNANGNRRRSKCSDDSLDMTMMMTTTATNSILEEEDPRDQYVTNPSDKTLRNKLRERTITFFRATRRSTSATELANEQKATRVLGLVFGCFIFCWTPFFIQNFTLAFCGGANNCYMPHWLTSMFLWLGYLSSTINPIIYTTFNKRFRQAFANILRCRCFRRDSLTASCQKRLSRASASSFHSVNNNYHGYLTSAATGGMTSPVITQHHHCYVNNSATSTTAYSKFNNNNNSINNALCRTPPDLVAANAAASDDIHYSLAAPILDAC